MVRSGMSNLITRLRGNTNTGTADYVVSATTYWTDDQLEDALDRHSCRHDRERIQPEPNYEGGTVSYTEYRYEYRNVEEAGTATRWRIETSDGTNVSTSNYSVDYNQRRITFTADQGGTPYFLTYYSYDLERAAADVWDDKAAHVSDRFDLKTDNHDMKRSQLHAMYTAEAAKWRKRAMPKMGVMYRGDVNVNGY